MGSQGFEIEDAMVTSATPEMVMDLILDPKTWPAWQGEIISAEGPTPLTPGDVVDGRAEMLGFNVDGLSVTQEVSGERYVQQVVVGVGMQIIYELTGTPEGLRVKHRLISQLPAGAGGRVLSFFLKRRLRKMQRGLLEELKRQAEGASS